MIISKENNSKIENENGNFPRGEQNGKIIVLVLVFIKILRCCKFIEENYKDDSHILTNIKKEF